MNRRITSILLLLFISMNIISQQNFIFDKNKADSLEKILPEATGNERIDMMNDLSFLYNRYIPARSDSLVNVALMLSVNTGYLPGEAYALYNRGILNYLDGNFSASTEDQLGALKIFEDLKDTAMIIDVYFQLAACMLFSESDLKKAREYLQTALDLAIVSGNNLRAAQAYASFGYIANAIVRDGDTGKQMFKNYYHYIEGIPVGSIEKALMIASYGDSFNLTGDTRTAINKYLESLKIYDPDVIEERALMAQCSSTLGNMYYSIDKRDSARYFYQYGIGLAHKFNHLFGLYRNFYYLAYFYFRTGNYENAVNYCDSSIYYGGIASMLGSFYGRPEFERVSGSSMEIYVPISKGYKIYLAWTFMRFSYELLQKTYEATGNIAKAYENFKSFTSIKDSMSTYERNKELKEIQARYETEKKEEQIEVLSHANEIQQMKIRQNKLFVIGMGSLVVLIVLLAIILLRQNKIKADHQAILLKQRLFRSQMNPHFIFNSLGSIQSSVINEEPDKAVRYLSRFSKLMRNILDSSIEEVVPLQEELETIENYLELQKVRFANKFDYTIDIDPDIDIETVMIPPMLAQPFIENSIEHGVKHKEGKGRIAIRIGRLDDWAIFEVEDDGIGRARAMDLQLKQEKNHKSLATVITRERIAALNRKSKKKITLEIIDLTDQNGQTSGTLVKFTIPIG